jgi:hypothetical protein
VSLHHTGHSASHYRLEGLLVTPNGKQGISHAILQFGDICAPLLIEKALL